jgi:GTP cyclohydrolase II
LRNVERALGDLRRGTPVIVREGAYASMVLAAEGVLPESLTYLRAVSATPPALAITARRARRLGFEADDAVETVGRAAVRVDLAGGVSADDVRMMVDPSISSSADLPQPLGLRVIAPGGLEAATVELLKLSGMLPAAVLAPIPDQRLGYLDEWALAEQVLVVETDDISTYRTREAQALTAVGTAALPLAGGHDAKVIAFRPPDGGTEHLVIVIGAPDPQAPALVRVHSQCFTGDLLGSLRCDCGDQLHGAIDEIQKAGGGVLVYLTQEGRGIGLVNKLRAYSLQDGGLDTIDANEQLGFEADERIYLPAAEMLRRLGYTKIRLLTNNPDKLASLARWGIEIVEHVPHSFPSNEHNRRYLETKQSRGGHLL